MRRAVIGTVGLLLAAASARGAPFLPRIVLDGDGVIVGATHAAFGRTERSRAIALVATALGKPRRVGSHGECGNGDTIDFALFRGDFELAFVRGALTGWTADGPQPRTTRGIGVGIRLSTLRSAYRDIYVDPGDEKNGGLGPSFQREGGPHGWLSGTRPTAKVTGLFAGETCLPGI